MEVSRTTVGLEEAALRWKQHVAGGRRREADETAEAIIHALAPMIGQTARSRYSPDIPIAWLVQAGNVAVIGALERYDANAPATFKTFVITAVRGAVSNYLRDESAGTIKQPAYLRELRRKVRRAEVTLAEQGNLTPTRAQIAEISGLKERQVKLVDDSAPALRDMLRFGSGNISGGEIDPERHPACAVDWIEQTDRRLILDAAIARLPLAYQGVIRGRFYNGETHDEIAARLGCSRETARRMEASALKKLATFLGPDATDLLL